MSSVEQDNESVLARQKSFPATHWSLVLEAGGRCSPASTAALSTLCQAYWYPLYAYVRRRGSGIHEAQDLTQAFFARLLEKNDLAYATQERGKFRSFLLASMKHFLANEWDRGRAQKRGGSQTLISIDLEYAEGRYGFEPSHELTAEMIFERRWALVLLEQVLSRLQEESAQVGKSELFERLKPLLTGDRSVASYSKLAADLKTTEGALKVAIHRLRRRYRELLRAEIGQTVADPQQIDEEIGELFKAIGS